MTTTGPWEIAGDLADGARLSRLRYQGVDLLTSPLANFRPPARDYGRYETRPVYGYDDCFPTVEVCDEWPDHGELCWLNWSGSLTDCSVRSQRWPVTFARQIQLEAARATWNFSVRNDGDRPLAFQHVMHPLMPLEQIAHLELPVAGAAETLLKIPRGRTEMFYYRDIREGRFALTWRQGLRLEVQFDRALFPTLSVWWNNSGYPDEDGLRRSECAFEPTPGRDSKLTNGTVLRVDPQSTLRWQVVWEVR